MEHRCSRASLAVLAALMGWACAGIEPELRSLLEATAQESAAQEKHTGPSVEIADSGPARYVRPLHEAFRPHRAMELVTFIDRFYRAPANPGYDEVLERLDRALSEAGFGGADARLSLEYLEAPQPEHAWTPLRAELVLLVDGQEPRVLHSFAKSEDVDRVMLPINASSCDLTAEVALRLDELRKGMIFVTDVRSSQVMGRAKDRGAAAVISASLEAYNEDKTGAQRQLEAIKFTRVSSDDLPTAQISPKSFHAIEAAAEGASKRGAKLRLRFQAEVEFEERPLRTLVATIQGAKHPGEAIATVSHVQEPGANDNASGAAGLVESARSLVECLRAGTIPWPDRTLVFLWGDEFRQSEIWLNSTKLKPVAGISSDMTGQSREGTQAIALLERTPDPGAIKVLDPDFHTPWGAGQVSPEDFLYDGLAVIARCAIADVTMLEEGNWETAEHPWEGGSDHDKFIQRGIPAVLFWHFTDFTYHTSLDRMQYVDPAEMRRTGVALLATALAVASAGPGDLERYVNSLEIERLLRRRAAEEVNDEDMRDAWEKWSKRSRGWLRNLCLGIDEEIPEPKEATPK